MSPPVASQRDGARFDRAIGGIESHNQRLERLRAPFPSFNKIFLVGNGAAPQEPFLLKHGAPELAIQSEARESREPVTPTLCPKERGRMVVPRRPLSPRGRGAG
jgi:hypothetical protein